MIIDLHGLTESEAIPQILSALFSLEQGDCDEVEIITGKGLVLRRVLMEILEEEGYTYYTQNNNDGSFIVRYK